MYKQYEKLRSACSVAIKEGYSYRKNLANRRFLVIYRDRDSGDIKHLEVVFRPSNYQHLTGIDLIDENNRVKQRAAIEFYRKCVTGQLLPTEIRLHDDFTTKLKLECLPRLMEFTSITKIAGQYDKSKPLLVGDYLLGGQNGCIAVSLSKGKSYYYPRSALNEDIRTLVTSSSQVLAILQTKHDPKLDEFVYSEVCYQARGVDITRVNLPEDLQEMVSFNDAMGEKQKENSVKTERKKSIIERLQENQRIIEEQEKNREPKPKRSRSASIED